MKLLDTQITVVGAGGNWGKGETLDEAMKSAASPKYYVAYVAHPDSKVTATGSISWPRSKDAIKDRIDIRYAPKVICRKERKQKRSPLQSNTGL